MLTDELADSLDLDRLDLARLMTESFPEWAVLKNADRAMAGVGDIDAIASPQSWPDIARLFASWSGDRSYDAVIVCRHVPGIVELIALRFEDCDVLQLDLFDRMSFRGRPLALVDAFSRVLEIDPLGFRRVPRGAEGLLRLVLNGQRFGSADTEEVRALIASDPNGVDKAADLFGLAAGAARRLAEAVLAGRPRPVGAAAALTVWSACSGLLHPRFFCRRLLYRTVWLRRCPTESSGAGRHLARGADGRLLPSELREWIAAAASADEVLPLARTTVGVS